MVIAPPSGASTTAMRAWSTAFFSLESPRAKWMTSSRKFSSWRCGGSMRCAMFLALERGWAPSRGTEQMTTSARSEEHTSELQSRLHLVCRLLLEKKKQTEQNPAHTLTHKTHTRSC